MKKVLIVEDDPFIRDITTIKLSEHGYSVIAAQNGEDALKAMELEVPDVVILDLDLPVISGIEVLSQMKQNASLQGTKTIIFSNNDDPLIREKVDTLGIEGFFIKASTDYSELYKIIDSL